MPKVQVVNMQGAPVGEMELNEQIFGIEPNIPVMHAAVVAQRANARVGTHSTLGRSEVRGGGRKLATRVRAGPEQVPYVPLLRGSGVIFGPKPETIVRNCLRKLEISSLLGTFQQS